MAIFGDFDGDLSGTSKAGNQVLTVVENSGFSTTVFGDVTGNLAEHAVGGSDTIDTGSRSLLVYGDALTMAGNAQGGDDSIKGSGRFGSLYGDASEMIDDSRGGNDQITGSFDIGNIYGDASSISGHSQAGNDALAIRAINGTAFGDAWTLSEYAIGGNDILTSTDTLVSNLYGDAHAINDYASGGDDRLVSGTGTDNMWGDALEMRNTSQGGKDVFAFSTNNGIDFIHDFHTGEDLIEFNNFYRFENLALSSSKDVISFFDLIIREKYVNQDGVIDSVIEFDAANEITVFNAHLTASDFVFKAESSPAPFTPNSLTFRVSGDGYAGNAQFVIKVDGQQVGGVRTALASHAQGQSGDVTLQGNFTGAHDISLTFINDAYNGPGQDRNLYLDYLSLNGHVLQAETASFYGGVTLADEVALYGNGTGVCFDVSSVSGLPNSTLV